MLQPVCVRIEKWSIKGTTYIPSGIYVYQKRKLAPKMAFPQVKDGADELAHLLPMALINTLGTALHSILVAN